MKKLHSLSKCLSLIIPFCTNLLYGENATMHLDNALCQSGVCFRPWDKESENCKDADGNVVKSEYEERYSNIDIGMFKDIRNKLIALLFVNYKNAEAAIAYCYKYGVSVNYIVDGNGDVHRTVDPDRFSNYAAGISKWGDLSIKNNKGNDTVNPSTISIFMLRPQGEKKDQQFENACGFINMLQHNYGIPGWNVVTGADVAPNRKKDLPNLFDFKKAYDELNVGFFPDRNTEIDNEVITKFEDEDFYLFLAALGYGYLGQNKSKVMAQYQNRYSHDNIDGGLFDDTKKKILQHVISLYNYEDIITGEKYTFFRDAIDAWERQNPIQEKVKELDQLISSYSKKIRKIKLKV